MRHVLMVGWGIFCIGLGVILLTCIVGSCDAGSSFWGKYNCVFGGYLLAMHGRASWRWMDRGE